MNTFFSVIFRWDFHELIHGSWMIIHESIFYSHFWLGIPWMIASWIVAWRKHSWIYNFLWRKKKIFFYFYEYIFKFSWIHSPNLWIQWRNNSWNFMNSFNKLFIVSVKHEFYHWILIVYYELLHQLIHGVMIVVSCVIGY